MHVIVHAHVHVHVHVHVPVVHVHAALEVHVHGSLNIFPSLFIAYNVACVLCSVAP